MKHMVLGTAALVGLFAATTLIINLPVQGNGDDRKGDERNREDEGKLEVQIGFRIAPVKLNLKDKDPELVGLGSYIVNAQGGCNDCHTCPSYTAGHNPFPPPFGVSGDGQVNPIGYLAGGVDFGPPGNVVTSANLTPDPATGRPEGLTLEQFEIAIRTGHDPVRNDNLAVMPWPYYRYMTGRDLDAIYAYLSAIPSATPPATHCANAGQ
ncbi:MAG: hypothetical protein WB586_26855 [Chthoniobacterales bacterium]